MPIPVHDHPQSSSVQLVLQGQLRVRKYRLLEVILDPALVKLECLSDRELHPGSTTTIGEPSNNIHGLQAVSESAVVLSLQVPPCVAKAQAWYSLPRTLFQRWINPLSGTEKNKIRRSD